MKDVVRPDGGVRCAVNKKRSVHTGGQVATASYVHTKSIIVDQLYSGNP